MSAHPSIAGALAAPATLERARVGGAGIPDARGKARIERLVREHHVFVWRSVRRFGVREADIDDVVQEVFLVAAKNIDAIELGRERGYLFRTSINVAAHARRSFQRRREVVDEERLIAEIDLRPSPEQSAATSEERVRLQSILDAMSEDLRAVFVLFELESMTMADIAETLGIPPGTVASRLRRARELFMIHVGIVQRECEDR
jgi:RNA polymerase sigma-70 factor, ECF subfamily